MREQHKHIIEEELWDYLDEELQEDRKAAVEEHLQGCPSCEKSFIELSLFNQDVSSAVMMVPSMRFTKNVMELIEIEVSRQEYKPLLKKFWRRMAISSFATMSLAMVVVAIAFPGSEQLPFQLEAQNLSNIIGQIPVLLQNQSVIIALLSVAGLWGLYLLDKIVLSKIVRRS